MKSERQEEKTEGTRTEFRYGALARRVVLPEGTKEETIAATYTDGIQEVTASPVLLMLRCRSCRRRGRSVRSPCGRRRRRA
ncbi:Hsp20/alpha crystallin family protein [Cryptosporangium sp. NPDC051539]|uniref:Hsp20/alpha crystallin family protein n=1 Tax=Cryptosporangium sp. NPDC051539 TaxID=3363962 RepID=UPI0037923035